jgi:hypothetical protein
MVNLQRCITISYFGIILQFNIYYTAMLTQQNNINKQCYFIICKFTLTYLYVNLCRNNIQTYQLNLDFSSKKQNLQSSEITYIHVAQYLIFLTNHNK